MWQRFSERARRIVFYAQEETRRFNMAYVSTEHLLLGLCREDDTTAAIILRSLSISLQDIKAEIEKRLPMGSESATSDLVLTPRAKRVIDLAYEEARDVNDGFIGTEHLLLGMIREHDGMAGRVLEAKFHVTLAIARQAMAEVRNSQGNPIGERSEKSMESAVAPDTASAFRERMGYRALLIRQGICLPEFLTMIVLADNSAAELLRAVGVRP